MKKGVSCIVTAYNEEKRITDVLSILNKSNLVKETVIINDGSEDNTSIVIKKFIKKKNKFKLINFKENHGKAYGVWEGLTSTKYPIILLIDADLMGLKEKHIRSLVNPIINNEADMTISFRENTMFYHKLLRVDPTSGERAFRKDFLKGMKSYKNARFGIEAIINDFVLKKTHRIFIVRFDKVKSPYKSKKQGFIKGIIKELKMIKEILKVMPIHKLIYQYITLTIVSKRNFK